MQPILDFLAAHTTEILAVLVTLLFVLKDYNVLKQILAGIFLDVEKRFRDEATAGGPEKIAAAVESALKAIPARFSFVLTILSVVLGTTREELATKLAQIIFDKIRAQTAAQIAPK